MGVTPLPFVKEPSLSLALCFLQPDDGDPVAAMAPSSMGAQGPHPVTQIGASASPTAHDYHSPCTLLESSATVPMHAT